MIGESLYYFGGALGLLIFNFLADNIGRKKVLAIVLLIGSISMYFIYFIDNVYVILIAFFFEGIGIESFVVVAFVYLSEISGFFF